MRQNAAFLVACWACMLAFSFAQHPIPAVNEPHYLTKAMHLWQPDWCARDLLLASVDAHVVFFWTFGGVVSALGFTTTAVLGRCLGLLLFAAAWTSFSLRLTNSRLAAFVALAAVLALNVVGTLAGEWIVGGIEGKVPAWAFSLFALRYLLDRRWVGYGAHTGLAISFHPVVGAWLGVVSLAAEAYRTFRGDPPWAEGRLRQLVLGAVVGGALAAPGLVPAIRVLATPTEIPPEIAAEVRDAEHLREKADYIQVFGRLRHHMDPLDFPARNWWLYGGLTLVWLWNWRAGRGLDSKINLVLAAAVAIALMGALAGYGPRPASQMAGYAWRAKLLKLYPFRFADALLPMVVTLQIAAWAVTRFGDRSRLLASVGGLTMALALAVPAQQPIVDRAQTRGDWLDACQWVLKNTESNVLCVTPRESRDFKWYAQRAEFVNFKDCPQDAPGIVEWNRRLWLLQDWQIEAIADHLYTAEDLALLSERTTAEYLVTRPRVDPFQPEPVYQNQTYQIYELRPVGKNRP